MNFFNEPYDVQVILGLTLVGIPNSWDEMKLVGFIKSYSYAFGPNEVCIVSSYLEPQKEGVRKAHITFITGDEDKYCQIITIRPYCFWIKLDQGSDAIPYMLPKYGSQDISYELIEAKMLLHKNNIHPSIVTCLMELNLIPTDGLYWTASDAIAIWFGIKEQNEKLFNILEGLFEKVRASASSFEPYPYDLNDELVYSSNWSKLLIPGKNEFESSSLWPWDNTESITSYSSPDYIPTKKKQKSPKKIGCIRYENVRRRWVVDLSYEGKRLQKCFHETYYGLVGGLEQALKWRFEFLKESDAIISSSTELRTLGDIVEKIMMMDISEEQKYSLLESLKRMPEDYNNICTKNDIEHLIERKLIELGVDTGILYRYNEESQGDVRKVDLDDKEFVDDSYKKTYRTRKKSWDKIITDRRF